MTRRAISCNFWRVSLVWVNCEWSVNYLWITCESSEWMLEVPDNKVLENSAERLIFLNSPHGVTKQGKSSVTSSLSPVTVDVPASRRGRDMGWSNRCCWVRAALWERERRGTNDGHWNADVAYRLRWRGKLEVSMPLALWKWITKRREVVKRNGDILNRLIARQALVITQLLVRICHHQLKSQVVLLSGWATTIGRVHSYSQVIHKLFTTHSRVKRLQFIARRVKGRRSVAKTCWK